jgi:hypothetical protein
VRIPVPADGFPAPVERFGKDEATLLACGRCGAARQADPDELGMIDGLGVCPEECGGWMEWAYQEADKCPGCGALGWFADELDGACSRRCMLQAEYAKTLAAATYGKEAHRG